MWSLVSLVRRLPELWQDEQTRANLLGGAGLLAGLGAGVASYAVLREPLHVRLDRLTVRLRNAVGKLPTTGLRLLHLSDTHFQGLQWREQPKIESVCRACAGLEYDLLVHTGDFLHTDAGLPNVMRLLDGLPKPRLGAFAVFGNHDYTVYSHSRMLERAWAKYCETRRIHHADLTRASLATQLRTLVDFGDYFVNAPFDLKRTGQNDVNALERALAERNVVTLHNRYTRLTEPRVGVDLYIAGVEDVTEAAANARLALEGVPHDAPTVLLSHNPDILVDPAIAQVDLVLAGHTHGGQIVLPWIGAAHTQTNHLRRREVAGYLRRGNTQVYITRGIGEGIPLRFGASPQVTLLTLLPE